MDTFLNLSNKYRNLCDTKINLVQLCSGPIRRFYSECANIFRVLDGEDDFQKKIALDLWLLRANVLYALDHLDGEWVSVNPFRNSIVDRLNQIGVDASRISAFGKAVDLVVSLHESPKAAWIRSALECDNLNSNTASETLILQKIVTKQHVSLFTRREICAPLVSSVRNIFDEFTGRIIVPGAALNERDYSILLESGKFSQIDFLLYDVEKLRLPKRLNFDPGMFVGNALYLNEFNPVKTILIIDDIDEVEDGERTDELEKFHLENHGSIDEGSGNDQLRARSALCTSGMALTLPISDEGVYVLDQETRTVRRVQGEALVSGNVLALFPRNRLTLLDQLSAERGFDEENEKACDWRRSLSSVMLMRSAGEISTAMLERGAVSSIGTLRSSLSSWESGETIAPKHQEDFSALIRYLGAEGVLKEDDIEGYIEDRWERILRMRAVRIKSGSDIGHESASLLASLMEAVDSRSLLGEHVLSNGMPVLICQIDDLDSMAVPVQRSQLYDIDGVWEA